MYESACCQGANLAAVFLLAAQFCNAAAGAAGWTTLFSHSASNGLTYDAAGNVLSDGPNSYAYDGEGRVCSMQTSPYSGGTAAYGYLYDAEGRRVAKGTMTPNASQPCNPATNGFSLTESYVLGQGGEQLSTLNWSNGNSTWQSTNVYGEGELLATYDTAGLHFQLTDPLGTRRVQTNSAAEAELDCQSLPFGDQQSCFPDPSAPNDDADEDATGTQPPIHFTGKERDTESGLDYFGARYYGSSMGRFMSPDPVGPWAADVSDPQSWNFYNYARNNPLSNTDPTGLDCVHLSGYSYDAAGNLLFDGTNTLTYDSEGRLATATESGSSTTTYTYGADGQRVGKTVNGVTTNYVRDLDGTILTSYVYGTYTNVPQEMWVAGMHFGTVIATSGTTQTQTFSLTNWLGSEAVRTNPSTGIASSAYLSEPFGDGLLTLFGSNTNDIHFTGKERDTESGLDYFGARYVSSNMGRFLSPDWSSNPISIPFVRLDNPQTLNRYSYVNNNPLSRFDPYGHLDCPGGATQDVACLVQAGWNALKNLFSGGSGNSSSSSSSSGNTVAPSPDYQPQFRVTTRILPTFRPPDYYNFNAQLGFANPSFQYVPSTKNFFVNGAFAARKGIGVMATAGWSLSQRPEAYLGGRGVSGCGAYGVAACVGYSPGGGGWAFEVGVGTPTIGGSAGYAVDWNSNCDAYLQDVYQSLPVENPNGAVGIGSGLSITLARMISIANEARSSMNP